MNDVTCNWDQVRIVDPPPNCRILLLLDTSADEVFYNPPKRVEHSKLLKYIHLFGAVSSRLHAY